MIDLALLTARAGALDALPALCFAALLALAAAAWQLDALMHFEALGRSDLDDRPKYKAAKP